MSHWHRYPDRWNEITPPLRPHADVVGFFRRRLQSEQGCVLLLGVTPELYHAFPCVDAFDLDPTMIARVWPGDVHGKRARQGDWLDLPAAERRYAAAVGDGSINAVPPREAGRLLEHAASRVVPGGVVACRVFERPSIPFTREALKESTGCSKALNFHDFKLQVAMMLADERGSAVPVKLIREAFDALFPDRKALAADTGWDERTIGMIDLYEASDVIYSFPDRRELLAAVPDHAVDVRFDQPGRYDLAECCPVLSFRTAG